MTQPVVITTNFLPQSFDPDPEKQALDNEALKDRVNIINFDGKVPKKKIKEDVKNGGAMKKLNCPQCFARWVLDKIEPVDLLEQQLETAQQELEKLTIRVRMKEANESFTLENE